MPEETETTTNALVASTADASSSSESAATVSHPVDAWFAHHFSNLGPHMSEDIYNRLHAAKEDLKVRLAAAG